MRKLAKLIITIFAIFALASVLALEADAFPDSDGDGIRNAIDNCFWTPNAGQIDDDTDGRGNECDNCVSITNSNQRDSDDDGDGNECDNSPYPPAPPCGAIQGTSNGSKQYEPGGPWKPDAEMLSFHIHTMITPSGDILPGDPDPQYDDSMLFVFGLFDTGSTLVLLHPGSAGYLGYDTVNRPLVNFGVWGTQAIDPATVSAPYRYPEVEIPNVKPRFEGNPNVPTLLGAPIANNVIAWIDYTNIIERVINPTWTERNPAMSFFEPDDPDIPTPLFWVELQQTETPFPPNDEATVGPRYLIPNMRFIREGHIAEGSDFTLMIDTGNTATQIGQNLAAALGIDAFTPVDDTIRRDGRDIPGYRISRVILDDMAGEKQYLISDPLVFVVPDISVRGVDANIGSNYFETTQVLIDGPGSRLGLYKALCPGQDAIPPSCDLTTINVGPPASIEITVQDMESGLASISVEQSDTDNADVTIPSFDDGTNNPVIVTATSTATGQESIVTLRIIDKAGNIRICQHSLTPPRCEATGHHREVNAYAEIKVWDDETGLASIISLGGPNVGSGSWPDFSPGTKEPVIGEVGVADNAEPASVTLRITDVAGNVTTCEHVFNEPPECDAGTYSPVECTGATTQVTLDGSGSEDPYGDELTFEWTGDFIEQTASGETPPVTFEGSEDFSVNLTVRVRYFPEATCEAIVPVVDTTPPELTAPPNVTAECISDTVTPVELGEPTVFDICDENVTVTNDSPTEFELGESTVHWTATDSSDNSSTATQTVTVVDTTPPALDVSVIPDVLWPPNHKMVPIMLTAEAIDVCDSEPIVELFEITMNEGDETITFDEIYDSTVGDGHTVGDIQVSSNGEVSLRAERSGKGDGRIYTITYIATDGSGNSSTASATVTVPHNQ